MEKGTPEPAEHGPEEQPPPERRGRIHHESLPFKHDLAPPAPRADRDTPLEARRFDAKDPAFAREARVTSGELFDLAGHVHLWRDDGERAIQQFGLSLECWQQAKFEPAERRERGARGMALLAEAHLDHWSRDPAGRGLHRQYAAELVQGLDRLSGRGVTPPAVEIASQRTALRDRLG